MHISAMEQKQLTFIISLITVGAVALFFLPKFFGDTTQEATSPSTTREVAAGTQEAHTPAPVANEADESSASDTSPHTVTEADADQARNAQQEELTVSVEGGNFYFNPDRIEVPQGARVRIVFHNRGGMHNWVIDEFDARTPVISTGETGEVSFVADRAGEFEYYCSVGNHRALGMKGTLVVVPSQ